MKLNELITDFKIILSNEEEQLLGRIDGAMIPEQFTEREQQIIENLIRKSVVSKVNHRGKLFLVKNEQHL